MKKTKVSLVTNLKSRALKILQELLIELIEDGKTDLYLGVDKLEERGITKEEMIKVGSASINVQSNSTISKITSDGMTLLIQGVKLIKDEVFYLTISKDIMEDYAIREWVTYFISLDMNKFQSDELNTFTIQIEEDEDPRAKEKFEEKMKEATVHTDELLKFWETLKN